MDDAGHDTYAARRRRPTAAAEPDPIPGPAPRIRGGAARREGVGRDAPEAAPAPSAAVLRLREREAPAEGPVRKSAGSARREAPPRLRKTPDPAPDPGSRTEPLPEAEPRTERPGPAVLPPASAARRRGRHSVLIASFVLGVVLPAVLAGAYLYLRAADQYASVTGFAVRTEESGSAIDIIGGLTNLGGSSSKDTDILYEFIQGQQIVSEIDRTLDLEGIFSEHWATDPVFSMRPDSPIEDLLDEWRRKVQISYDAGTGLIEVRALAFAPQDAQAIAAAIFERSAAKINEDNAIAREDATGYAREELEVAIERLKAAREAMSTFRSRTQIVDPAADLQGQMGLLNTLQQQLAAALIEYDLVRETAREGDPRIAQAERRIEVIERRIEDERGKFSIGGAEAGGEDYVAILAEFDRLDVDLQFAREAYTAALTAYDSAQAEAQRKSKYLAAYVAPTLPESAQYPRRAMLTALVALFLALTWAILTLIYYSIRDRR